MKKLINIVWLLFITVGYSGYSQCSTFQKEYEENIDNDFEINELLTSGGKFLRCNEIDLSSGMNFTADYIFNTLNNEKKPIFELIDSNTGGLLLAISIVNSRVAVTRKIASFNCNSWTNNGCTEKSEIIFEYMDFITWDDEFINHTSGHINFTITDNAMRIRVSKDKGKSWKTDLSYDGLHGSGITMSIEDDSDINFRIPAYHFSNIELKNISIQFGNLAYIDKVTIDDDVKSPETEYKLEDNPPIVDVNRTLDFGKAVLKTSTSKEIQIKNLGEQDLILSNLSLPSGFTAANAFTDGTVIQPADSLSFSVGMITETLGPKSGTLTFETNDPTNPSVSVALTGEVVMLSHLKFENNLLDENPANVFIPVGSLTYSDTEKAQGSHAVRIDAPDNLLHLPANENSPLLTEVIEERTIAFWFKADTIQKSMLYDEGGHDSGILFRLEANGIVFAARATSLANYSISGEECMNANVWYHVAGVFNKGVLQIYINGVLKNSRDVSSLITQIEGGRLGIGFGGHLGSSIFRHALNNNFRGYLDDLQMYSTALTEAEIAGIIESAEHVTLSDPCVDEDYFNTADGPPETTTPVGTGDALVSSDGHCKYYYVENEGFALYHFTEKNLPKFKTGVEHFSTTLTSNVSKLDAYHGSGLVVENTTKNEGSGSYIWLGNGNGDSSGNYTLGLYSTDQIQAGALFDVAPLRNLITDDDGDKCVLVALDKTTGSVNWTDEDDGLPTFDPDEQYQSTTFSEELPGRDSDTYPGMVSKDGRCKFYLEPEESNYGFGLYHYTDKQTPVFDTGRVNFSNEFVPMKALTSHYRGLRVINTDRPNGQGVVWRGFIGGIDENNENYKFHLYSKEEVRDLNLIPNNIDLLATDDDGCILAGIRPSTSHVSWTDEIGGEVVDYGDPSPPVPAYFNPADGPSVIPQFNTLSSVGTPRGTMVSDDGQCQFQQESLATSSNGFALYHYSDKVNPVFSTGTQNWDPAANNEGQLGKIIGFFVKRWGANPSQVWTGNGIGRSWFDYNLHLRSRDEVNNAIDLPATMKDLLVNGDGGSHIADDDGCLLFGYKTINHADDIERPINWTDEMGGEVGPEPVGRTAFATEGNVILTPNPTTGIINLEFETAYAGEIIFSIISADGRNLYTETREVKEGHQLIQINVEQLIDGLYFVKGVGADVNFSVKFMVEK